MKKLLCLLTALSLLCLFACSPASTPKTEETLPPTTEVKNYPNMNGYEFVVMHSDQSFVFESGAGLIADSRYQLYADAEELFHCDIVCEFIDISMFDRAQPILQAGDKFADIIPTYSFEVGSFIKNNYAQDISKITTLDLNAPCWDSRYTDIARFGEGLYAIKGAMNPPFEYTYCLVFNKNLCETLGLESPYELVKRNEWTWDKFAEYCRRATRDTNGDNMMTVDDCWGYGGARHDVDIAFWYSAGIPSYQLDERGNWEICINTPEAKTAADRLAQILTFDRTIYDLSGGEQWTYALWDLFPNDQLLFICNYTSMVKQSYLQEMTSDYGLLPIPKYHANQESFISSSDHFNSGIVIPIGNEQTEWTGALLQYLCERSYNEILPLMYEEYEMYMRDEESMEMLKLIHNTSAYEPVSSFFGVYNGEMTLATKQLIINVSLGLTDFSSFYEAYGEMTSENLKTLDAIGH